MWGRGGEKVCRVPTLPWTKRDYTQHPQKKTLLNSTLGYLLQEFTIFIIIRLIEKLTGILLWSQANSGKNLAQLFEKKIPCSTQALFYSIFFFYSFWELLIFAFFYKIFSNERFYVDLVTNNTSGLLSNIIESTAPITLLHYSNILVTFSSPILKNVH